ncbi:DUF2867 domain-containing protein [soil metagenome]
MAANVLATDPLIRQILPGAQFADTFHVITDDASLTARQAAERMFSRSPRWVAMLMTLRNILVKPFGLKTPSHAKPVTAHAIGIFPVLSETPTRLIAGFDDSHLDFRVVVDVLAATSGREVAATTLVKTHNLLGRAYLTVILPFHRLVVQAMLRQI